MSIYVVRHGQTDYNMKNVFQGHIDSKLNEVGIEQARETANQFKGKQIDLLLVSPLTRAKETAEIINEVTNAEMVIDERLIERSFGDMEGKPNREDWNIKMMLDYNKNYTKENIEPIQDFFKRIFNFLDDITKKYQNKNVILVTHGAVSQPIECYFHGMPEVANFDTLEPLTLKNCQVREYTDKEI